AGDETPYNGKHYQLGRLLNSPLPLSKPGPRILIGGGGEKKTLRLVALYGDACNLFAYNPSEVEHKLDVLRQHCEEVGRDYNAIEKTVMGAMDPGPNGENVDAMLETMRAMHDLGVTHFHGTVPNVASIKPLEILAERVIPEVAKF
ncbi:MAG: LLM class flavin-dependent oxidoreductase, partial [Mycobacteriales bacterium]